MAMVPRIHKRQLFLAVVAVHGTAGGQLLLYLTLIYDQYHLDVLTDLMSLTRSSVQGVGLVRPLTDEWVVHRPLTWTVTGDQELVDHQHQQHLNDDRP